MPQNVLASPNLFLVGAPKCGTTSLYEYLHSHPQIFFPSVKGDGYWRAKEPGYFCAVDEVPEEYSIKNKHDYLALYADSEQYRWRGDASACYLLSEGAPERIKAFCKDARILITLRPPVDMMRSWHRALLLERREDITDFHEAVAASGDRRNGLRVPSLPGVVPKWLDYFAVSRFAPQVEHYQRLFAADSIKVVLLEDIASRPEQTYREILQFLSVDSTFLPEFRIHNEALRQGSLERCFYLVRSLPGIKTLADRIFPYPIRRRVLSLIRGMDRSEPVSDRRDEELNKSYQSDVERLAELIGRDLSHWM